MSDDIVVAGSRGILLESLSGLHDCEQFRSLRMLLEGCNYELIKVQRQLQWKPIDTLKIDRSFIRDLPGNADDEAITKAIIAMGKSLNRSLIAEGVETQSRPRSFAPTRATNSRAIYSAGR